MFTKEDDIFPISSVLFIDRIIVLLEKSKVPGPVQDKLFWYLASYRLFIISTVLVGKV